MGGAVGAVDPAPGLGGGVVVVDAPVQNGGRGGDDTGFQRRHRRAGLEGGAGGVGAANGPVEQGSSLVIGGQCVINFIPLADVIGGVGGQCQHLAAAHAHHHGGAATTDAVRLGHVIDGLAESFFHVLLQVDVQRQSHGVAGLGFLGVELTGDLAIGGGGNEFGAVLAVEILLEGLLHAALAHQSVHGIPLVPVSHDAVVRIAHPVLLIDGTEPPQHMGGVGSVIHTGRGRAGGDTGIAAVHHLIDELHRHIAGEGVGTSCDVPQGQLVAHTDDSPCVGVGVAVRHAVELAQLGHEQRGLLRGPQGTHRDGGQILRLQIFPEGTLVGGGGVGKGRLLAHRQGVRPLDVVAAAQLQQPEDGVVAVRVAFKFLVGKHQRIGQPVGDQHLAVAVGDDATGGLHRLSGGVAGQRASLIVRSVEDLSIVQHAAEDQQDHPEDQYQRHQPGFGQIGFHSTLLSGDSLGVDPPAHPAEGKIDQHRQRQCHQDLPPRQR